MKFIVYCNEMLDSSLVHFDSAFFPLVTFFYAAVVNLEGSDGKGKYRREKDGNKL